MFRGDLPAPPEFAAELASRQQVRRAPTKRGRSLRFLVWPDQLSLEIGPWARADPDDAALVLIERGEWLSRRPYHRQRLAWILLSQRAFALEAADAGFAIEYVRGDRPIVDLLRTTAAEPMLQGMEPAEREGRVELAPLVAEGRLTLCPHDGFLTTPGDLAEAATSAGWRMDRFYEQVRRRTGILMDHGRPSGGRLSFDVENRKRWDGEPPAPAPLAFAPTRLREEIEQEIIERFRDHPGALHLESIPQGRAEVERFWNWAKGACLPNFGPYEDAMSRRSRGIFHTRISALVNLHRLLPSRVVAEVAALDLPLPSKEGFIRQVLGWREFVYQVHRATDGFRAICAPAEAPRPDVGDAGFARWAGRAWVPKAPPPPGVDGGARPNLLQATTPLPPAWWGTVSGLACLDHVVKDVWEEGWSHHITRLMVLSNLATLAGVDPRELCDWFWVAYIDAWDWVVEPNVLAMGTFAYDGMTTKPYVSGSAYLEKMGDSCRSCACTPGKDCPIGPLYWAFLARNGPVLGDNPRMKLPLASARTRSQRLRDADQSTFMALRELLVQGRRWTAGAPTGDGLFADDARGGR